MTLKTIHVNYIQKEMRPITVLKYSELHCDFCLQHQTLLLTMAESFVV